MAKIENIRFQLEEQPEIIISEAWEKLKDYRRKVGAAD
jgi:hypothetical protein